MKKQISLFLLIFSFFFLACNNTVRETPFADKEVLAPDHDSAEPAPDRTEGSLFSDDTAPQDNDSAEEPPLLDEDMIPSSDDNGELPDDDADENAFPLPGLVTWWALDGSGEDLIGTLDEFTGDGLSFEVTTRSDGGFSAHGEAVYGIDRASVARGGGVTISLWGLFTAVDAYQNALAEWYAEGDDGSIVIDGYSTRVMGSESSGDFDNRQSSVWYHFVVSLSDDGTWREYRNGSFIGSYSAPVAELSLFRIGRTVAHGHTSLASWVDDVMLFSRVLSDDEVEELFTLGENGF